MIRIPLPNTAPVSPAESAAWVSAKTAPTPMAGIAPGEAATADTRYATSTASTDAPVADMPNMSNITDDADDMTGWRTTASDASRLVERLLQLRAEIEQEYPIRDIIVLGVGGSALGAQVLTDQYALDLQHRGVRVRVIDTTEPDTIIAALSTFNAAAGLVIVASKSGGTVEPRSLEQVFFQHLCQVLGSAKAAAGHFISVSDEGTALTNLAKEQRWRGVIISPRNVGGRYSVMTAFGLAPLVLAGVAPNDLLASAQEMQQRCLEDEDCPAWQLSQSLYQNYCEGRDKLIISHNDPATESFARWLEQLLAESLGKEGNGLIPLPMNAGRANKLQYQGLQDVQSMSLAPMASSTLGAELVRWMFATEHLAQYLDVNPFDQPNVEAVKRSTQRALSGNSRILASSGFGVLLADSRIKQVQDLSELVTTVNDGASYIVLMSWAPETTQNNAALEHLAASLEAHYQRPVVIAVGPHYLHASGQLYKGGPNSGIYILVTQDSSGDLVIPGAAHTLRQLYYAAFAADIDVMMAQERLLVKLQ